MTFPVRVLCTVAGTITLQSTLSNDVYRSTVALGVASTWCLVRVRTTCAVNLVTGPVVDITIRFVRGS
jgi:hypothetical protein